MRPLIEVMSEAMHDLGDWNPQESAEYVEGRLRAAGFRILGPDEVDQVTLEKCAEEMESLAQFLRDDADKIVAEWTGQDFSDDENRANHQDARERRGRAPIYESAATAIRTIGRKA